MNDFGKGTTSAVPLRAARNAGVSPAPSNWLQSAVL